ncbi:MAG TPA: hypothetical protein DIW64_12940 [Cellvibrio sp.]|nr:hypothetical protein [Cellvibrio sp.]
MTTFFVKSMSCGSCARHITHAVKTLESRRGIGN